MSVSNRRTLDAVRMILAVASEKTGGEMPSKFEAIHFEVIAAFYEMMKMPMLEESYFSYQIGQYVYEVEKVFANKLLEQKEPEFSPIFYSALAFFLFNSSKEASRWWFFEMYGRISWITNVSPQKIDFQLDDETQEHCRKFGEIMQKYVERDLNALYGRPII